MAEHDEALVERGADAIRRVDDDALTRSNFERLCASYEEQARAVLDAVAPAIEARALREAADEIDGECPGVGAALVHPWMAIARSWLSDRADRIEGA